MIRIDGSPMGQMPAPSPAVGHQASQSGTFKGEAMEVKSAASVLADAAEEISLYQSEKVEKKKHGERDIRGESSPRQLQIEQVTAYLDAAQAFDDPRKLAELAKRMQTSGENPMALARQQSRDPAQQFALLHYALSDGERSGAPAEVLERLQDAIADLEMDHGPLIRASFNTIDVAAQWGQDASGVAGFQTAYHDVVLGENNLSQTLRIVLERLAGQDGAQFAQGLRSLLHALGADLAATRPSTDANRLQALVQDVYQLEVVATVLAASTELSEKLSPRAGARAFNPLDLTRELVNISGEKWVAASRFTALADRLGVSDIGERIAFQTQVKTMLRELPVKVFSDGDVRQSILNAAQEALDAAIDREEG